MKVGDGGQDTINVTSMSDVLPMPDIHVPIDMLDSIQRVLSLIHHVLDQSGSLLLPSTLEGAELHDNFRMRACKALDTLLQHPVVIGEYVKQV